jgi:hypothetical protein
MKYLYTILSLALFTSCNMPAETKTDSGEPEVPHTSSEWQIWAYSTAAPDYIAADATVFDGPPDMGGNLLREGSNGWTCLPANPRGQSDPENGWIDAHEAMPLCGDAEVFKWIGAYFAGETPVMDKDGYAWMLHGDMGEDNTMAGVMMKEDAAPGQWIESGPHLMRMPADPSSLDGMTTDFTSGAPYVMFGGTVYAHVMYPMVGYYDYQPESAPK